MHTLLKIAEKEIGQKEIAGAKHNQRIVQYSIDLGFPFRDDETAWCSIFMNWVALQAGFEKSNSGTAQSWLNVGKKVTSPEDGDVVLVSSSGNFNQISHVGLFYGFSEDKKKVLCLGGNQSDSVNISPYNLASIAGYRRLTKIAEGVSKEIKTETQVKVPTKTEENNEKQSQTLHIPREKLKFGDKSENVKLLQIALNAANFNCGKPDGEFGEMTENAVKALQENSRLRKTGKTNRSTRNALAKKLDLPTESLLDAIFGDDDDE